MAIFTNKSNGVSKATDAITSIIGEDLVITGNLSSQASIRIDGKVEGNISAKNMVVIGEKGDVKGDVQTKDLIVFGKLHGNTSVKQLQLKKTGNIHGDISVQSIEIEMGGKYNGKLLMSNEEPANIGKREVLKS